MIENTFIELPLGIFRKDIIISIECGTQKIDNGMFKKKQILPIIIVYMSDDSSHVFTFTNFEERNNVYDECVKILITNN